MMLPDMEAIRSSAPKGLLHCMQFIFSLSGRTDDLNATISAK
jgi:hypothetical protein